MESLDNEALQVIKQTTVFKHGLSFMQFISSLQGIEVFTEKGTRMYAFQLFQSNHSLDSILYGKQFKIKYLTEQEVKEKRRPILERKN